MISDLKVVIVGYGSIGKRHCKNLSKIKNIQCFIVTSQKKISLPSKNFQRVDSLDDCIKLQPDVAFITNESHLHVKSALKLAKLGCHLFIEKPLSNNLINIKKLSQVVKKKHLVTLMGCNLRFHPCLIKIKKLILAKKIGRILFVQAEHGSYLPDWHPNENYKKSYASQKKMGGGVVLTSIHELDYLYWIFGDITEIFSITGKYSDLGIDAEDLSSILLKFKNNIVGEVHLDYFQKPSNRGCKIVGSKGTLTWNISKNNINFFNNKTGKWEKLFEIKNFDFNTTYIEEIKHFLHCSTNNKKTINDIEQGTQVLKIALKVLKSSRSKKMEKL